MVIQYKQCGSCKQIVPNSNMKLVELEDKKGFFGKPKEQLMCDACIKEHNEQYEKRLVK